MTATPTLSVRFSGPRRSFHVAVTSRETIFFAGSLCKDDSYERSFPDPLTHPPQRRVETNIWQSTRLPKMPQFQHKKTKFPWALLVPGPLHLQSTAALAHSRC